MSRTYHHGKDRRIRVRGKRRPTDVRRLARALIELEYQTAQKEAEAEQQAKRSKSKKHRNAAASRGRRSDGYSNDVVSAALAARSDARTDCASLSPAGLGRWSTDHH